MIEIYTDGSCKGNGTKAAQGGFGIVVYENGVIIDAYSEMLDAVTNNQMELKAILWAQEKYGNCLNPPTVYSDSAYCVNTFNNWMAGWKKKGWLKSDNRPPENLDLIKRYDMNETIGRKINLVKVKGHATCEGNNFADALATGRITIGELKDGR